MIGTAATSPRSRAVGAASAQTDPAATDHATRHETRAADLTRRDLRQLYLLRASRSFGRHACACYCREAHTQTAHPTEPLDVNLETRAGATLTNIARRGCSHRTLWRRCRPRQCRSRQRRRAVARRLGSESRAARRPSVGLVALVSGSH